MANGIGNPQGLPSSFTAGAGGPDPTMLATMQMLNALQQSGASTVFGSQRPGRGGPVIQGPGGAFPGGGSRFPTPGSTPTDVTEILRRAFQSMDTGPASALTAVRSPFSLFPNMEVPTRLQKILGGALATPAGDRLQSRGIDAVTEVLRKVGGLIKGDQTSFPGNAPGTGTVTHKGP